MKTAIELVQEVFGKDSVWTGPQLLQLKQLVDLARADEREKWMERTAILIRGEREACAKNLDEAAQRLTAGKRTNQVDRHVADVLNRQAEYIRARKNHE